MITCGTQIVSGAPVNGGGSSAPSGTGIVSVTDGVYDMPGVTTVDLAAAFAGLGLSAVLAGCSSYLAFTSLADTSVFTGGLTRAVGTLTGVDNQALGVPVGTRFAVSFSGGGAQAYGGIYIVTNAGSVSTQPVITRAAEFDSSADFAALSDAGWPCGDSGLLRLSTTGGTTLDTSPVEFDVALGAVALEALIAAAIPASTLTTRGDLLRRGASAAERVALGAAGTLLRSDGTDPAWSTLTIPDTAARGTVLVASAANTVTALDAKTANYFLVGDGTDLLSLAPAAARAAIGVAGGSVLAYGTGADTAWTGWTLSSPTNTTTSIVGGRLRVVTTANVGFVGGNATLTLSQSLLMTGFRVRARLATYTGADANSRWGIYAGHSSFWQIVNSSGSTGGAANGAGGDSAVSAVPVDGTGWVELAFNAGVLSVWYGTGTTSVAPTAWKLFRSAAIALTGSGVTSAFPVVTLFAGQVAGGAVSVTCEWDHVTIAPIGVGL